MRDGWLFQQDLSVQIAFCAAIGSLALSSIVSLFRAIRRTK